MARLRPAVGPFGDPELLQLARLIADTPAHRGTYPNRLQWLAALRRIDPEQYESLRNAHLPLTKGK